MKSVSKYMPIFLMLLIFPILVYADAPSSLKGNQPDAAGADQSPYHLGEQQKSDVFELSEIAIPEDAVVKGFTKEGDSCVGDPEGRCEFQFDKPVEVQFSGYAGECLGIFNNLGRPVIDSFQISGIWISKEYFDKEVFEITDKNHLVMGEKYQDTGSDRREFACYKLEGSDEKYCPLSFTKGGIKNENRGVRLTIPSMEQFDVNFGESFRLYIYCAEKGTLPYEQTEVKLNGMALSDIKSKLDKVEKIEFDFGKTLVPLSVVVMKDKLGKDRRYEGKIVTSVTIDGIDSETGPNPTEIAASINKVIGDGSVAGNSEKVKKWVFEKIAKGGFSKGKNSKLKVSAQVPKGVLTYGFRPKSVKIEFDQKDAEGLGPSTQVEVLADKALKGIREFEVKTTAVQKYYPKIFEYAKGLMDLAIKISPTGVDFEKESEKIKLIWPKEIDEKPSYQTFELGSKTYKFEGDAVNDVIDLTKEAGELPNGDYMVRSGDESLDDSYKFYDEKRIIISNRKGVTQFTLNRKDRENATMYFDGTYPPTKITLKDKSRHAALIAIDGEADDPKQCEIAQYHPCELAINATEVRLGIDEGAKQPFYRILGNKLLLLAIEDPKDWNDGVIITIVPLTKEIGYEGGARTGNLIKSLRVAKAYQDTEPLKPPYPRYAKEGGTFEFTQEMEKIVFNFDLDLEKESYIFTVTDPAASNQEIYKTSYRAGLYDKARTASGKYFATESWRGNYLPASKDEPLRFVPSDHIYLLNLKICKKGMENCRSDSVPVVVNANGGATAKPTDPKQAGSQATVLVSAKGLEQGQVAMMSASQYTKGAVLKEGAPSEAVFMDIATPPMLAIPDGGLTLHTTTGGVMHIYAELESVDGNVIAKDRKTLIIQEKKYEVVFDFKGLVEEPIVPGDARKLKIIGPLPTSGGAYNAFLDGSQIEFIKNPQAASTIVQLAKAQEGKKVKVEVVQGALQRKLFGSETKSREVLFDYKSYLGSAGQPNFIVKITNFPHSAADMPSAYDPAKAFSCSGFSGCSKVKQTIRKYADDNFPGKCEGKITVEELSLYYYAQLWQESQFNPSAVNKISGAAGMCQFLPAAMKDYGVGDPFNYEQCIEGLSKFMKKNMERFDCNIESSLAAYNAGPTGFERDGEGKNYARIVTNRYKSLILGAAGKLQINPYPVKISFGFVKETQRPLGASKFTYTGGPDSAAYSNLFASSPSGKIDYDDEMYLEFVDAAGKVVLKKNFRVSYLHETVEVDFSEMELIS